MYETFKKLKFNQTVLITFSSSFDGDPKERLFKVGRRTFSKKYQVEKLSLTPYHLSKEKKLSPLCKFYLYLRDKDLSLAWSNMACSLHGIREPESSSPYAVKTVSKAIS